MKGKSQIQYRVCPDIASRPARDSCACPATPYNQSAQSCPGPPKVHDNFAEDRIKPLRWCGCFALGNRPRLLDQGHINADLWQVPRERLQIPRADPTSVPVAEHQRGSGNTSHNVVKMNPCSPTGRLIVLDSIRLGQRDQLRMVRVSTSD
jgi:hypothetical protein